ncbi:FtsX-like permease family protein [Candidatus Uhrbacteria bacterium]|nr:FtsX-like permease family protein [Candidatus Uhrbacteria bacterium]
MTLLRILKFGCQNIARNFWLSVLTVTMLLLTLITINVLLVLQVAGQTAITSVEKRIDLVVTFRPDTREELARATQQYLIAFSQVKDARVVTPDEALAEFRQERANDPEVLEALEQVGDNPFGYSLVVTARDPNDFPFVLEALDHPSYAPSIEQKHFQDYEAIITTLANMTQSLRIFGIVLAALFLFISIVIVVNTVRVAIYIYREEIAIMRLVGASSAMIRGPFWFEAVLYSFLATLVAAGVTYPAILILERYADSFFAPENAGIWDFYVAYAPVVWAAQFLGLALINILAANLAMRKYLKV